MVLCPCGFANRDGAATCAMCGSALNPDAEARDESGRLLAGMQAGGAEEAQSAAGEACRAAASTRAQDSQGEESSSLALGVTLPSEAAGEDARDAPPTLVLENMRTAERIAVPAPGGIIGRAGDFSPESFSRRVSGVHLVATPLENGRGWNLEFMGRNTTAVNAGGSWINLSVGSSAPVFGGELLKMADMLFRVKLEDDAKPEEDTLSKCEHATEDAPESPSRPRRNSTTAAFSPDERDEKTPAETDDLVWTVRCPVCGTSYEVDGGEDHVAVCTVCADALDRTQIGRVAPRQTRRR